jgi:hypothetical protein
MRWARHVAHVGGENVHIGFFFMGPSEGRESLGRRRCRSEDIIKMNLQGIGGRIWIGLS